MCTLKPLGMPVPVNPGTPRSPPTLPRLPLLPSNSHQPIKQLISQHHSRQNIRVALLVLNLDPIRDLTVKCPSDDKLGFPTETTQLLQLLDLGDRYGPDGFEILVAFVCCSGGGDGCVEGEGDAGDCRFGADVCLQEEVRTSAIVLDMRIPIQVVI